MEFKPSLSASRLVSRLAVPDNLRPRVIHFSGPSFRRRMHHAPWANHAAANWISSPFIRDENEENTRCHLSPSLDSHPPLTFSLVNLGNLPSRRGSEDYSSPQLPGGDGFHRGEGGMGDGWHNDMVGKRKKQRGKQEVRETRDERGGRTGTTAYSMFPRVTDYSIYEPCRMILNRGTHCAG